MEKHLSHQFNLSLQDNIELMKSYENNCFDLAVVDPPYGIGQDWKKSPKGTHRNHNSTYKNDKIPSNEYFEELKRVSKNQIIWGGNYYPLPLTNNWIVWDKKRNVTKTFCSECELAWTSFNIPMRIYRHQWDGAKKERETGRSKIHPHQKPVALYKWILKNYASRGFKILDTHLGSMSIAIAVHELNSIDKMKLHLTGCEIDKEYFKAGVERIKKHTIQPSIFQL